MRKKQNLEQMKKALLQDGKLYFSKETERRIFFFMTLIMLASGLLIKLL